MENILVYFNCNISYSINIGYLCRRTLYFNKNYPPNVSDHDWRHIIVISVV